MTLRETRLKKGQTQRQAAEEAGCTLRTYERREQKERERAILFSHPNRNEIPESHTDPFTSLIRSLELLRMLATQLKEGNFLNDTD